MSVLRAGLHADDFTVRGEATQLIHDLGARGYVEFGALVHNV
jgi:hypothetical protein